METQNRFLVHHAGATTVAGLVNETRKVIHLGVVTNSDASRAHRRQLAKLKAFENPYGNLKYNEEVDGDSAAKSFYTWCEERYQPEPTHEVLDLLVDAEYVSVVSAFKGTEVECETWLAGQVDPETYSIVPLRDAHTAV